MRVIGYLQPELAAKSFSDYLYVQGIDNQVEPEENGMWAVWIHAEDHLEKARELLGIFQANPKDPRYHQEGAKAELLRLEEEKTNRAYAARVQDRTTLFRRLAGYGLGPVTLFFIILCTIEFLLSGLGMNDKFILPLLMSEHVFPGLEGWAKFSGLEEIRHGQIWRLFSPILVHSGWLHIIFNLLWLRDLGSMIEARMGGRYLVLMILITAGISNLAEFFVNGPGFGGMSGVVYGLFGFIWMRTRFDPNSGLYLHPTTVTMMIIWFFVCYTGLIGHVANYAHAGGLITGMLWGWFTSGAHRRG